VSLVERELIMPNMSLSRNGFLHVPQAFNQTKVINILKHINAVLSENKHSNDILYENNTPKKLLYAFNKGSIFLETLVSDPVINLLKENSDDFTRAVPTWEDIVIKQPQAKNGFNPHQDLPMQSLTGNTFSIAIYLHDAAHNPVSFLPKSHQLGALTRDQINEIFYHNIQQFVAVPAKAGDIVMHYAKTIHYSPDNITDKPRYTWYIEFRTLDQLYNDSPWNQEWIQRRRAIFVYALEKYQPDKLAEFAPDYEELQPYLKAIQLKVTHITEYVDFDMTSPYFHF
jgi:hypothetical protein